VKLVSSRLLQRCNDDASNHSAAASPYTSTVPDFGFFVKFLLPSWPHPCNASETRFGKNYFVDRNTSSFSLINASAIPDFEWWFLRLLWWIGWDNNCSMLSSADNASLYLPKCDCRCDKCNPSVTITRWLVLIWFTTLQLDSLLLSRLSITYPNCIIFLPPISWKMWETLSANFPFPFCWLKVIWGDVYV
jgi:hypothetical protein